MTTERASVAVDGVAYVAMFVHGPDGVTAGTSVSNGFAFGDGRNRDEAMTDLQSAIRFHVDTFGASGARA